MVRWGVVKLACVGLVCMLGAAEVQSRPAAFGHSPERVALGSLPMQAQETYQRVRQGGPFPFDKDGGVFGNRERILPPQARGYYREYTVVTAGSRDRGARRIVCGGPPRVPVACFYTADHYASFRQIEP